MASIMKTTLSFELVISCPYIPDFPLHNLLHGEEKLFMIKPSISTGVKYQIEHEIIDIQDKGKNGVIYVRLTCYEVGDQGKREKVYYNDRSYFVKGLGGFGFKGNNASSVLPNAPEKAHDVEFTERTFPNQCFIYRLCEDPNPLHIDPNMASMAGFEKPIIHGIFNSIQVSQPMEPWLEDSANISSQTITPLSRPSVSSSLGMSFQVKLFE